MKVTAVTTTMKRWHPTRAWVLTVLREAGYDHRQAVDTKKGRGAKAVRREERVTA